MFDYLINSNYANFQINVFKLEVNIVIVIKVGIK